MNEMRTAIAKKINDKKRIIPVIVEKCEVPSALPSTLRFEVGKDGSIIDIADKIADIVHGVTMKPALSSAAGYLSGSTVSVPGLSPKEAFVLDKIYRCVIANGHDRVSIDDIVLDSAANGVSEADMDDCIEILEGDGWLAELAYAIGRRLPIMAKVPSQSILQLAKANGTDIDSLRCKVAGFILNQGITDDRSLAAKASCPPPILGAILSDCQSQGVLERQLRMGGHNYVRNVGAKLRRWFANEC